MIKIMTILHRNNSKHDLLSQFIVKYLDKIFI